MMAEAVDPSTGCVLSIPIVRTRPTTMSRESLQPDSCKRPDIAVLVPAFRAGSLSPEDRVSVRDHCNVCKPCEDKVRGRSRRQEN